MTDEQRKALKPGQRVIVRCDDGVEREYVVKYEPWLIGRYWLIGLRTVIGGYALERVVRMADEQADDSEATSRRRNDFPGEPELGAGG